MNTNQNGFEAARFPGTVNPDYTCGICLAVVNDPVQCSNQGADLFCRHCLTEWYKKKPECPTCRAKANCVNGKPVADGLSLILKKQIMALDITCSFEERGCAKVAKIETIFAHEKECDYNYSDVAIKKFEAMQTMLDNKDETITKLSAELKTAKKDSVKNDATIYNLRSELAAIKTTNLPSKRSHHSNMDLDSFFAKRSKLDLAVEVEVLMKNKNTKWATCEEAKKLNLEMKYALLKSQITFSKRGWDNDPDIKDFFQTVSILKPDDNVLYLGDIQIQQLAAVALFVGKRGSVNVYFDCCSPSKQKRYEKSIKEAKVKLETLLTEANVVFLRNGQDYSSALNKECYNFIYEGDYESLATEVDIVSDERKSQGAKFTIEDAVEILKKSQTNRETSSAK